MSISKQETLSNQISSDTKKQIDNWLKKFPSNQKKSAALYALRLVQEENDGWLTKELMLAVADYLDIPPIAVFEVATFYSMYNLKPVGRNQVKICTSISCMLRGSDKIIAHIRDRFGIGVGETTSDGFFTLQDAECLAACGIAPMLQINNKEYHGNITPEKMDILLKQLKEMEADDGK
jgi:NADH-quinone oxidoreductase subunit E